MKLGAFDLLEKPFQNELLYHSILRALTALKNERRSGKLIEDLKQSRSELLTQQQRLERVNAQLQDTNGPFRFLPRISNVRGLKRRSKSH